MGSLAGMNLVRNLESHFLVDPLVPHAVVHFKFQEDEGFLMIGFGVEMCLIK